MDRMRSYFLIQNDNQNKIACCLNCCWLWFFLASPPIQKAQMSLRCCVVLWGWRWSRRKQRPTEQTTHLNEEDDFLYRYTRIKGGFSGILQKGSIHSRVKTDWCLTQRTLMLVDWMDGGWLRWWLVGRYYLYVYHSDQHVEARRNNSRIKTLLPTPTTTFIRIQITNNGQPFSAFSGHLKNQVPSHYTAL